MPFPFPVMVVDQTRAGVLNRRAGQLPAIGGLVELEVQRPHHVRPASIADPIDYNNNRPHSAHGGLSHVNRCWSGSENPPASRDLNGGWGK